MSYAPDLTTAAIKMVMALGVVLLIVWGLYRLAKGRLNVQSAGRRKHIHVMESHYVGVKKSVAMVQVPGSILVLGIGTDTVNLLTQIDDQEVIRGIQSEAAEHRPVSFKEHLQKLTQPKTRQSLKTHSESATVSSCEP